MMSRKIDMMANKFNIDIYLNNLKLLCSLAKLTQQEFSDLLEKGNAFRRETGSISDDVLSKLSRCFNGISREWLVSENKDTKNIRFNPPEDVIDKFYPGLRHLFLPTEKPAPKRDRSSETLVKAAEAFCAVLVEESEKTVRKKPGKQTPVMLRKAAGMNGN